MGGGHSGSKVTQPGPLSDHDENESPRTFERFHGGRGGMGYHNPVDPRGGAGVDWAWDTTIQSPRVGVRANLVGDPAYGGSRFCINLERCVGGVQQSRRRTRVPPDAYCEL